MNGRAELSPLDPDSPRKTPLPSPDAGAEIDDEWPLELDDESWDALIPDDDYEPAPEPGDFWTERDAA